MPATLLDLPRIIEAMCQGDTRAFVSIRGLLDDIDLLEQSDNTDDVAQFALYFSKRFVVDVLSNLSGDTPYGFPEETSEFTNRFGEIVFGTGLFLKELVLAEERNTHLALNHIIAAYTAYIDVLRMVDALAEVSDLRDIGPDQIGDTSGLK